MASPMPWLPPVTRKRLACKAPPLEPIITAMSRREIATGTSMTRLRLLVFVTVVFAASPGGDASSVQAPAAVYPRLAIGVVRGDGIFLPLASKENDTWTILRAYSRAGDASLYQLDAERVPREGWTYVPRDTVVPRPLAIRDMVTTD